MKNRGEVRSFKDTVHWRGRPVTVDALQVNDQTVHVDGRFMNTAVLRDKWQEDLKDPETAIEQLRKSDLTVDVLRFWQRIPESDAKFAYYHETRHIAAIPVTTHEHWWTKQVNNKTRNMVRKATKRGVEIREEALSDDLVRGVMGIYNESQVRRGKPFWHYGKSFESVKAGLSKEVDRAVFVTAYFEEELIGFIKLLLLDRYPGITLILDKMSHRDKSPMNALISKAVEICANKRIPAVIYTVWRRAEHGRFQASNGFVKSPVPEYFVPLTFKGRLALRLNLHRGLRGLVSEALMLRLLRLRAKWYGLKFDSKPFSFKRLSKAEK